MQENEKAEYLSRKVTGFDLCFIICIETEWRLDWRENIGGGCIK